jgi:hypothetical protein
MLRKMVQFLQATGTRTVETSSDRDLKKLMGKSSAIGWESLHNYRDMIHICNIMLCRRRWIPVQDAVALLRLFGTKK